MAWQVGKMFHNSVQGKRRVLVLISWTRSWSRTRLWTRSGTGPRCSSFGWWLWTSLGRWLLLWRIGTRPTPWPGLRLSISFTIFFGRSRSGPGPGPRLLRLLLRSAVRARTPVRLGFRFALWSRFPAFRSGTWAVFASWPGFRSGTTFRDTTGPAAAAPTSTTSASRSSSRSWPWPAARVRSSMAWPWLVFYQPDLPSIYLCAIQFVQGTFHVRIWSELNYSFVCTFFVSICIGHLTSLPHKIFQILPTTATGKVFNNQSVLSTNRRSIFISSRLSPTAISATTPTFIVQRNKVRLSPSTKKIKTFWKS